MSNYRVTVRIRPYVKHRLGASQSAELPAKLELGPFTLVADGGVESHSVQVEIAGGDAQSALLDAVDQIRDVLIALAARGDAYAIEVFPPPKVEAVQAPVRITETESGASVAVDSILSFTEHVGVVVRRGDYSATSTAVAAREKWPAWLRVALELNYMGETAIEDRPALISFCSALEVITHATQGKITAVGRSVLGRKASRDVYVELLELLKEHGFNEDQAERAALQALNAHTVGLSDRIRQCLAQLDVAATIADITFVTKTRGAVVHADKQPSDEDVRRAIGLTRGWLFVACPRLLELLA